MGGFETNTLNQVDLVDDYMQRHANVDLQNYTVEDFVQSQNEDQHERDQPNKPCPFLAQVAMERSVEGVHEVIEQVNAGIKAMQEDLSDVYNLLDLSDDEPETPEPKTQREQKQAQDKVIKEEQSVENKLPMPPEREADEHTKDSTLLAEKQIAVTDSSSNHSPSKSTLSVQSPRENQEEDINRSRSIPTKESPLIRDEVLLTTVDIPIPKVFKSIIKEPIGAEIAHEMLHPTNVRETQIQTVSLNNIVAEQDDPPAILHEFYNQVSEEPPTFVSNPGPTVSTFNIEVLPLPIVEQLQSQPEAERVIVSTAKIEREDYDEETLQTFDELSILLSEQAIQSDAALIEKQSAAPDTNLEDRDVSVMSEEELESAIDQLILDLHSEQSVAEARTAAPTQSFEEFLADQSDTIETLSFEAITEQADEQPVEDTLLQFITSLSKAVSVLTDEADATEHNIIIEGIEPEMIADNIVAAETIDNSITYEIMIALSELEDAISASLETTEYGIDNPSLSNIKTLPIDNNEAELVVPTVTKETAEDIEITPELTLTPLITEKILALLETLGYEDPQEALLEMAETHSVAFTLEAFQEVAKAAASLKIRDDYREIMTFASVSNDNSTSSQSIHARFGQALIWIAQQFTAQVR